MQSDATIDASAARLSRRILAELFGPPAQRSFAVRYWDGTEEGPAAPVPFTIVLRHPSTLRRLLLPPSEIAMAEAYLRDDFDVEGNLEQTTALAGTLTGLVRSPLRLARVAAMLMQLPPGESADETALSPGAAGTPRASGRRHSQQRDAASVRAHYDLGNDFYALWLDQRMVYSCAYFPTGNEDLDAAQEAKLEHICRKLRLQEGESLLDIGCGWGGLVQYAAERYGVQATGITLSKEQAHLAKERISAAGLAERVKIAVRDYRALPPGTRFDKVVSVGMLEHVGRARMRAYFETAWRVTKPGGIFLAHGIVSQQRPDLAQRLEGAARKLRGERDFIDRYVFPDGELLAAWELARAAEQAGWELRDAENLREHYALTLRQWVRRLEAQHERAAALVGEDSYRVWRLYMSGAARGFAGGELGVVQFVLSRREADGTAHLPLTRADLYRAP